MNKIFFATTAIISFATIATIEASAQIRANQSAPTRVMQLQTNDGSRVARHNLTSAAYQREFTKWTNKGYRPVELTGYALKGSPRFAVIFEKKSGPAYEARHNLNGQQYQAVFTEWTGKGYRLTDISGYETKNGVRYAALFEKKSGPAWKASHGLTSQAYQQKFDEMKSKGFRLEHISGYTAGGQPRFAAIFTKKNGPRLRARHNLSASAYQTTFNDMAKDGYRLKQVSGYQSNGKPRFAAIWEKSNRRTLARHGLSNKNYQTEFDNQKYTGYRLQAISGYAVGDKVRYAAVWDGGGLTQTDEREVNTTVKDFLSKYNIPGVSIAIARNGKLVYARGYGKAISENNTWMSPKHRQRIASVSKPITSSAIMKLIEDTDLELGDKVFGPGSILGTKYGNAPYKAGYTDITLQQVLEHTAGLPTNNGDDPMFKNKDFNHDELFDWTIDNYNLHSTPGSDYRYSNFGYAVLGRVIEEVSGKNYQSYVRDAIMKPAGANGPIIGGNTKAQRKKGEVVYYAQSGNAYSHNIARMDAHGGWISSPIDLMRFAVRFDGEPTKADYISGPSRATMLTVSPQNGSYAKGWVVSGSGNASHNGFIWGNRARMKCRSDDICWAVLMNGHSTNSNFGGDANELGDVVTNLIDEWPTYDLF